MLAEIIVSSFWGLAAFLWVLLIFKVIRQSWRRHNERLDDDMAYFRANGRFRHHG